MVLHNFEIGKMKEKKINDALDTFLIKDILRTYG